MKKLKVILVEFIGDCGCWEWYRVQRNTTPKKAILSCLEDFDYNKKQKIFLDKDGRWYSEENDFRAITLDI